MEDTIEQARKLIEAGAEVIKVKMETGGRPKEVYDVGGLVLSKREIEEVKKNKPAPVIKVMTPEEFATFSRSAIPELMQKLYHLAKRSDDIREVTMVMREFADRGFGKAVQSVQVSVDSRVKEAWDSLDNYDKPKLPIIDVDDGEELE